MSSGIETFVENLKRLPQTLKASVARHGPPVSDRSRSQAIFGNLFLHLHSTRVHIRTLRFSATMAMGIMSISLFMILTATGVLLMVYYKPSVDLAYDSIKDIHYVVPTGRFIRNIHRWAAHLMVATVLLHMCRVFYTASYKAPREFNWLLGMGLLVLTLALSFTGYLLPWDQLAYWAITIGANIAASPRELTDVLGITAYFDPGGLQKELLLGASEVGQEALTRFYLLHVIVLPLAVAALVGVHFWRIRKDGGLGRPGGTPTAAGKGASGTGPTAPVDAPRKTYGLMCVVRDRSPVVNADPKDTVPSWPNLLRAELVVLMLTMLVCVVLGVLFDAPLKELANPTVPENPAKAPWYFLGLQEMVSYSAFMGGLIIPLIVMAGLGLIPYLDREPEDAGVYCSGKPGKQVAVQSLVFGVIAAVLSVAVPVNFGWLRNWFPDISQLAIIFINPGTLLTVAYALWSIWMLKKTGSTRMAAIALFTCFVIGFLILTYVGTYLRGPNWDFYWSSDQWPAH
ncbi:MAG: cytochrome b N-terminal domain-containing protein [bacterium]|nr:cytochrome b N-terminal domain-containing protein [bacterium]